MRQRHLRRPTAAWPLVLFAVVVAAVATAITGYLQTRPQPLPVLFEAPAFEMTSQHGSTFSSTRDLRGKVWVASFVFTTCAGPCPAMTARVAELHRSVHSDRVRYVTFSVDPARDTPPVLAAYADRFNADGRRWLFLTAPGTSYLDVAAGFKVIARPAEGVHPIFHSEKFFLVDTAGRVRGFYSHADPAQVEQLKTDIGRLLNE